jgi:biopolymer transport protein ExbB
MRVSILLLLLWIIPGIAHAWWNEDWSNRVKIKVESQTLDHLGEKTINDSSILLRLHTGNFSDFFYFNEDVSDIRFLADDDITPLKYHVEKFDLINQLMYVWIKFPTLSTKDRNKFIYLYYGNAKAISAEDRGGSYEVNQIAVFHFDGTTNVVIDSSAYMQKAELINVERQPASLIGTGIKFNGESGVQIIKAPALNYLPGKGFSFSAWIKPQGMQQDAYIFNHQTNMGNLLLGVEQSGLYARWQNENGDVFQTSPIAPLTPDSWQHVALNLDAQRLAVFVNGVEMASVNVGVSAFETTGFSIGFAGSEVEMQHGYVGEMDEVVISSVTRSPQWFSLINSTQGQSASLLSLSASEQMDSGESVSYFASILKSVSLDGWIVIGLLMLMAAISWMVMVGKMLMIHRMQKDNKAFMQDFNNLSSNETASLDAANDEDINSGSDFVNVMFGKHDHYQSSPNYHLYHQGVHELKQRTGQSVGASAHNLLSPQSISAIRATLDASLVRENQRLSSNMVLLTIAIAGGPFLGLLGTVLGVMITFAAIAISGNVDINAIAPGVSAALMTTVAGLFVAIPALFGYNYLSVRIKDSMFDMEVFVDEFVSKIAEQHS